MTHKKQPFLVILFLTVATPALLLHASDEGVRTQEAKAFVERVMAARPKTPEWIKEGKLISDPRFFTSTLQEEWLKNKIDLLEAGSPEAAESIYAFLRDGGIEQCRMVAEHIPTLVSAALSDSSPESRVAIACLSCLEDLGGTASSDKFIATPAFTKQMPHLIKILMSERNSKVHEIVCGVFADFILRSTRFGDVVIAPEILVGLFAAQERFPSLGRYLDELDENPS